MDYIPFNKPFIAGKELFYIAQDVIENHHTAGDGPFTKKCQKWLQEQLGSQKALLTHSCTAALEMAAILSGIKSGDEVIMSSYTFVSTANAFVLRGGIPVFVDIRPDTLNINEALIEDAISPKTRAIIPVHYAGVPCQMDTIMEIAKRKRLLVIEDAAQALLSRYHNRYIGTIGQMACLSFHETKNIISGEGGAILINDPLLIERAEIIREKGTNRSQFFRGQVDKYTWVDIGSSYLPSDIIAAFLYAQMENADQIIAQRNLIYDLYMEGLRPLAEKGCIQLPFILNDCCSNGHMFYIITRSLEERTKLTEFLKERGILAVFHYVPLHSSPAGKLYGRAHGTLDVTKRVSDCLLRLPLYYEMTNNDVNSVTKSIRDFYKNS
ncbi:4-keto-6-deoxy-n-acetyl-d-hexosaminyl-(lipid carrier) aminotransferase [hydrocarbon metagenome]|uniref:4-keto-6-deoxy-n-acetyl-d-hexosaminyl-(Lipid carrier) aminotransferase n=1 Tax=hydrocarbon metagenome TaxID=938273 RepID=A0A0W8FV25_9ZZZZ